MNKLATIKVQGGEYATVPVRLQAFREANPRADISTEHTFTEDGSVVFKATIIQDRADDTSPKATGTSFGRMTGAKAFEKQETIAVGRALSNLGYLNNGMIATTEEMEEFESYRADKILTEIENAETREELVEIWKGMDASNKSELTDIFKKKMESINGTKD